MSRLKNRLLVIVLLMSAASPALAQRDRDTWTNSLTAEIAGEVRLPDGTKPPANSVVYLERFSGGIVDQMAVDSRGKFRFSGLQRGYYTLSIKAPGFNTAQQQVDLQIAFRTYVVVDLTPDKIMTRPGSAGPAGVLYAGVPLEAQEEFTRARAELLKEHVKEALPHLEKATRLSPDFFEAQLLLGTTYLQMNRLEEAARTLRRTLEIKPEAAPALFALGEIYRRQKHYMDAEKMLLEGLRLDEESWPGHFTLARIYWENGDTLKAGAQVGRALQLKADFAEAHLLAGNILLRLNQMERALFEYQEYLRLEPKGEFAAQTLELVQKLKQMPAEKKK
ncbi:MAG TPA: tetratricopeptide repeat protein [Pyrinomonadaceae bacterium]